ncbi:hypothetical protein AOCH_006060 [Aspergillus ochraceoroseus]|uniref:Uncharacterized protein n=1 Tax=Aspergillus ochraceoroseus TaxID=138278 RepID=A0A0F8V253_9EURO|nr:hypothetical protein AOCH_006060 [Aspergillus ochraceoroseus]
MSGETCEVPIMLSPENLTYEDIAKLNPFYEEYRAFWTDSPGLTDTSFSSDDSSKAPSLQSNYSGSDPSSLPFEMPASPLFHIKPLPAVPVAENLRVALHTHSECKPTYDEYHGRQVSQMAVVEVDERHPSKAPTVMNDCDSFHDDDDAVTPDPVDLTLGRTRSSHKKLFGENGWLGCTAELGTPPTNRLRYKSLKGLGKKIKQHVEEIAGDMARVYPNPFHTSYEPRVVPELTIPVSFDPEVQAKLYSEMEVMICVSANNFLVQQYKDGRISKDSIKKVANFWGSKNRPQVAEFRFDQATQRRLILSNIRTLHFSGESSTNPVLLNSNLHNWKAIVKEMSVRTFCAPDSVIRKHMHDIQKLLDMLGAPADTFLAFEDLQVRTLGLMKEHWAKKYLAQHERSPSLSGHQSR